MAQLWAKQTRQNLQNSQNREVHFGTKIRKWPNTELRARNKWPTEHCKTCKPCNTRKIEKSILEPNSESDRTQLQAKQERAKHRIVKKNINGQTENSKKQELWRAGLNRTIQN